MQKIEVGDAVVFKAGGGPVMSVYSRNDLYADVQWFDRKTKVFLKESFALAQLERAPEKSDK